MHPYDEKEIGKKKNNKILEDSNSNNSDLYNINQRGFIYWTALVELIIHQLLPHVGLHDNNHLQYL